MVEEKSLTRQIEELTEKAAKYENLKSRYVEHAQKIKKAADSLKQASDYLVELAKEIDPLLAVGKNKARNTPNKNFSEIIDEVLSKMLNGTEITVEFLQRTYNLNNSQSSYVTTAIKKRNNKILIRRNGRIATYYLQKTI